VVTILQYISLPKLWTFKSCLLCWMQCGLLRGLWPWPVISDASKKRYKFQEIILVTFTTVRRCTYVRKGAHIQPFIRLIKGWWVFKPLLRRNDSIPGKTTKVSSFDIVHMHFVNNMEWIKAIFHIYLWFVNQRESWRLP
jgi:hypothetical protein